MYMYMSLGNVYRIFNLSKLQVIASHHMTSKLHGQELNVVHIMTEIWCMLLLYV